MCCVRCVCFVSVICFVCLMCGLVVASVECGVCVVGVVLCVVFVSCL